MVPGILLSVKLQFSGFNTGCQSHYSVTHLCGCVCVCVCVRTSHGCTCMCNLIGKEMSCEIPDTDTSTDKDTCYSCDNCAALQMHTHTLAHMFTHQK